VEASWNRYNTYAGIVDLMKKINKAYPNLTRLESIGKSYEKRYLYVNHLRFLKLGTQMKNQPCILMVTYIPMKYKAQSFLCTLSWYLTEMFGDLEFINELLKDKTFYIVPTINPDARDNFMKEPNTPHSPRSGMIVLDNDGDGKAGEDGFDDLDGNNHITYMIRKSPTGQYIKDPQDDRRLIRVAAEEKGEYEMLGYEGMDNDGDGEVNEDGIGYYDPNRDWGWKWQPDYVQRGAYKYPF